jgi:hypothetical protein
MAQGLRRNRNNQEEVPVTNCEHINCEHIEDLFSDRFDGELDARDQETFEKHLATCTSCNANWLAFQEAVSMLGQSGGRETSPELAAATLAAVDAASMPSRNASQTKPLLLAAFLGAAAALLIAWLVVGMSSGSMSFDSMRSDRALNITVDSGVVALQPGESRSQNGLMLSRSDSGQLTVRAEEVEAKVVEVRVEVPVDRIVEVPVEVPVEVRVPVEVPVEVIVKVPVEVRRGPLFTFDTSPLASALREASKQLGASMEALAAARHADSKALQQSPIKPMRSPLANRQRPPREPRVPGSTLRVNRTDGRIQLETSGTIEELVPTLLAQLETPDTELCSMIQRRLAAIHEEAAQNPNIRDGLADMPSGNAIPTQQPSLFGDPSRPARAPAPAVAWAQWWQANSQLLTQTASL